MLVGLCIVNEQFPTAGAGNQHGAQQGAWDRTGTITEQLPHASYSVRINGSGRISQRTRQHLRQFIPNDSLTTRNAERTFNTHAEQGPNRQSASQPDGCQRRDASPLASQADGQRSAIQRGDPNDMRARTSPAAIQESPIGENDGVGLQAMQAARRRRLLPTHQEEENYAREEPDRGKDPLAIEFKQRVS